MNRFAERKITALATRLNGMKGITKREWQELLNECAGIKFGFRLSKAQETRIGELEDLVLSKWKDIPH